MIFLIILTTLPLYKGEGIKAILKARYGLLSCVASIEEVKKINKKGREIVVVRSKVDKLGGLFGFLVRFLRLYKPGDVYETYIDIKTHLPIESISWSGAKKNEHIYYDRENGRIKSLVNGKEINNTPKDIQDATSILINFLYLANKDSLYVGKTMEANMNVGVESFDKVIVKITEKEETPKGIVYTFTSMKLPKITRYPITLNAKLLDDGEKVSPIEGFGIIKLPIIGDIKIKGELEMSNVK